MRTSFWRPPNRGPFGSGRPSGTKETHLHRTEDVLATLSMIRQYKLDVRTVTMGIDLQPCAASDTSTLCDRIRERLVHYAGRLRAVCREVEGATAFRSSTAGSPSARSPLGGLRPAAGRLSRDCPDARRGGGRGGCRPARLHRPGEGWTEGIRALIAALPEVLSSTERVCASVNVGTTAAGINMDAIARAWATCSQTTASGTARTTASAVPSS